MFQKGNTLRKGKAAWNRGLSTPNPRKGIPTGIPMSADCKAKISAKLKGRKRAPMSEEQKIKISIARYGNHYHSAESKEKIRQRMMGNKYGKGIKHTEEWKKNHSNIMKGRKLSEETKKRMSDCKKGFHPVTEFKSGNKHPNFKGDNALYKNISYCKAKAFKRKSLLLNAGELTAKIIQIVYEKNIKLYGTLTCYLCLNQIEFGKDHLEHKLPLSRGGKNTIDNLDAACGRCNLSKHDKTEEEYRNWLLKKEAI